VSADSQVRLDLEALRRQLAAAGQLRPLGLGCVLEGAGALDRLAAAVAGLTTVGARVVVLAAATPMSVSGRDVRAAVEEALRHRFPLRWVTLGHEDEPLHADERTVAAAVAAAAGAGCVVTVGSGTITDIGKAAAGGGTPLIAVQTATSVNGYADPFSVLLRQGVKRTTPTRWPDTLVIDSGILSAAPPELNLAGVGDLMAMFTSSADWYLASAIGRGQAGGAPAGAGDPPYHALVAGLTRAHGDRLLALAAGGLGADPDRLAELARILTLSGIGMGVAGSTAPASGMEHAVSHLIEMAAAARGKHASFHGTQVGVASVVAAATWARVRHRIADGALSRPARLPDPDTARDRITKAFAPIDSSGAMAAECFADYAVKLSRLASGGDPLAGLRAAWPEHDAVLAELIIEPGELASALRAAGLPASFGELPEVSDADARWAVANCMLLRRRLGVADLAVLIGGWQDSDVDELLACAASIAGRS
jgi:glycerol-1-phosphate dehydrogenase [NAD(P)+]